MADTSESTFRELMLLGDHVRPGASVSFSIGGDDSYVTFRRHDKTPALVISRKRGQLSITEKSAGKGWHLFAGPVPLGGHPAEVVVTLDQSTATVEAAALEAPVTVPVSSLHSLIAGGTVDDFGYRPIEDVQTTSAKAAVIASRSDLPKLGPTFRQDLIFDMGMWNGDDTSYFLKRGYTVVAVEANPTLAAQGAHRFAGEINAGQLTIVNLGLADRCGELPFFISLVSSEQSSFDERMALRRGPIRKQSVSTVTPDVLWRSFGVPYYLIIDIEGFDGLVLSSLAELADPPRYVSFEIAHRGWRSAISDLSAIGYHRFKISDQQKVPDLALPNPSQHGLQVEHIFPAASSGPFGEDLPGEWVTADGFNDAFERARAANPENDGWYDVHAAQG